MDIQLTPEQQAFVSSKISAGSYQSPGDVIEAGLDALTKLEHMRLELNEKIQAAQDEAAEGLGIPGDKWYQQAMKKWGGGDE